MIEPIYQRYPGWHDRTLESQQKNLEKRHLLLGWIRDTALSFLKDDLVTTKRGMYYRAAAADKYPKGDTREIYEVIKYGLLTGLLPWNAFTDVGRSITKWQEWTSAKEFLESMVGRFRARLWDKQPERVVVLVEKDALLGVIEPTCNKYRVPFGAIKGDPGDVYLHNDLFEPYALLAIQHKQKLILLVLTDCNPSGWDMVRVVERKLAAYSAAEYSGMGRYEVIRIALTEQQVIDNNLLGLGEPVKRENSKTKSSGYPLAEEWDLDALPPAVLQEIVAKAIDDHLDLAKWKKALAFQKREQKKLTK